MKKCNLVNTVIASVGALTLIAEMNTSAIRAKRMRLAGGDS